MAAWLPVLKAALPYVSSIVAAALPVFTARRGTDAPAELLSRQIAELQEAGIHNAEAVKGLAAQVEKTITALDGGEAELARRLAALQETLARCESTANLVQAQATRQEGVATSMQIQIDELERQVEAARRRELAITAAALVALLVAVIALLI